MARVSERLIEWLAVRVRVLGLARAYRRLGGFVDA